MEQASDKIGPWYAQFVHPHSMLYVACYPVFLGVAHKVLVGMGFKNPVVDHHLLTTQLLRVANAALAICVGMYTLAKHPKFLSELFTNHHMAPQVDFVARFAGCGFHLVDVVAIVMAYRLGYMTDFRWDLIAHHLSVWFLGVAYNYIRTEGVMCIMFLLDGLPFPTFIVLLMRALLAEGLCSPATAARISIVPKVLRLIMLLLRLPAWLLLAHSTANDVKKQGWQNASIPQIMVLLFVVLIFFLDVKWSKQMIDGLKHSKKRFDVTEIKPKQS